MRVGPQRVFKVLDLCVYVCLEARETLDYLVQNIAC